MFGIKLAITTDDKNRVGEYLESKGVKVLPGTGFSFIEIDGEIKAAAGYHPDLGGAIEPLVSEGVSYTKTLGIFMYGYMIGQGYSYISCWTQNEEWSAILQKEGFIVENTNRLIKGV
jgi:hypothetical protein